MARQMQNEISQNDRIRIEMLQCGCGHFSNAAERVEKKVCGGTRLGPARMTLSWRRAVGVSHRTVRTVRSAVRVGRPEKEYTHIEALQCGCIHFNTAAGTGQEKKLPGTKLGPARMTLSWRRAVGVSHRTVRTVKSAVRVGRPEKEYTHIEALQCGCIHFNTAAGTGQEKNCREQNLARPG
jgi:hypothetical protein